MATNYSPMGIQFSNYKDVQPTKQNQVAKLSSKGSPAKGNPNTGSLPGSNGDFGSGKSLGPNESVKDAGSTLGNPQDISKWNPFKAQDNRAQL